MKEIKEALEAALELVAWVCEKTNSASYDFEQKGIPLEKTKAWEELEESSRDGRLASYESQFHEALEKMKKTNAIYRR